MSQKLITQEEFVALINKKRGNKSIKQFAPELKVSNQFLGKVINQGVNPGPFLAEKMGYEQVPAFRKKAAKKKKAAKPAAKKEQPKAAAATA